MRDAEILDREAEGDRLVRRCRRTGASITRRRRSVSSPRAGISTLSGAPPGAAAGTSWICPSVIAMMPGQPRARDVGQRAVDRGEQPRAGVAGFRHGDGAQFEIGQLRRLRLDRCAGRIREVRRDCRPASMRSGPRPAGRCRAASRAFPAPAAARRARAAARRRRAPARACHARAARRPGPATSRQSMPRARDQPDRQQRVEAERGEGLFRMHLIARAAPGSPGTWTWSPL